MNDAPLLTARGVSKAFRGGDGSTLPVLSGADLDLRPGECVAIVGASGAGKSTLLHLLGALDAPSAGAITLAGTPYTGLSRAELAGFRNRRIGFVFQFHHLLRDFTALENVMMPLRIAGVPEPECRARADALLDAVGLSARGSHRPAQLSGGEQQRVAVARALVTEPDLFLADEPSGNLDPGNADRLHDLLMAVARGAGRAMVIVTHNRSLAERADRVLTLHDGRLEPVEGAEVLTP